MSFYAMLQYSVVILIKMSDKIKMLHFRESFDTLVGHTNIP